MPITGILFIDVIYLLNIILLIIQLAFLVCNRTDMLWFSSSSIFSFRSVSLKTISRLCSEEYWGRY